MNTAEKSFNEIHRFGFSEWGNDDQIREAGLFQRQPDSVFLGYHGRKRVWSRGQSPLAIFAPPRAGKLSMNLAYNCIGPEVHEGHCVFLDIKGELNQISQNQMWSGKQVFVWNPQKLHGRRGICNDLHL